MDMSVNREVINNVLAIKRNINEIFRNRIFIKDFEAKIIRYVYELDDILNCINVDILLVNFYFKNRENRFAQVYKIYT
jgi:hypothetical protein